MRWGMGYKLPLSAIGIGLMALGLFADPLLTSKGIERIKRVEELGEAQKEADRLSRDRALRFFETQRMSGIAQARRTPLAGPNELEVDVSGIRKSLASASYAFNHPDRMYVSRRTQITLTLARDEVAAKEALSSLFDKGVDGSVKTGAARISPAMKAILRGKDFKIDPPDFQEKLISMGDTEKIQWTWYVEPMEPAGRGKLLTLSLFALPTRKGDQLPPMEVKTLEARIDVEVLPFDRVTLYARQLTPISQALTGIGGLIAVFGAVRSFRRWLKRGSAQVSA